MDEGVAVAVVVGVSGMLQDFQSVYLVVQNIVEQCQCIIFLHISLRLPNMDPSINIFMSGSVFYVYLYVLGGSILD